MATTQAQQFYAQHPAMRTMLGELKVAYDARQVRGTSCARSCLMLLNECAL